MWGAGREGKSELLVYGLAVFFFVFFCVCVCVCVSVLFSFIGRLFSVIVALLDIFCITTFDLITAHNPVSTKSSYSVVFKLQPVYFLSTFL